MVSVEDLLRANGVTVASDFTYRANGVSADGNVLVGETVNATAFIARVVPTVPGGPSPGSGIIDVEQHFGTLASRPSVQIGLDHAGTILNGAHGDPMRNLLDAGRQSSSMTTDLGYNDGAGLHGGLGIANLGYGIGLEGGATARLSVGGLYTRQDIDTGGDFTQDGFYVVPEVSLPVMDGLYATLGG